MDTRDSILAAAAAEFAATGTRGATTRRIAEAAGMNEVTLFRHFGSKAALMTEALAWVADRVEVPALPDEPVEPAAELAVWCTAHLTALTRARSLVRAALAESEDNAAARSVGCDVPARAAAELSGYLDRLRSRGLCDAAVDGPSATAFLMGALLGDAISRDIMPARYPWSVEESAERYARLFTRAIGAERIGHD